MIASFSRSLVLMTSIIKSLGVIDQVHPENSPEENAVIVYYNFLFVEAIVLVITAVFSLIVGYLYEIL